MSLPSGIFSGLSATDEILDCVGERVDGIAFGNILWAERADELGFI